MCLALYKPAKATLNQEEMRTAFKANPDGAGFAYYDPALRRTVIQRGYFTFDSLWKDLKPIMEDNCPLILHFRWATHGDVNVENCHPFALQDGALIHNGIISGMGESTYKSSNKYYTPPVGKTCADMECSDDRSDTREFVEDYLADMDMLALLSAKKLIEHTIGYSKLVTIHDDGTVIIFNEQSGHWRNGVWYSNDSYKKAKALSANPANLTPTKSAGYDYHGTSSKSADAYWSKWNDFDGQVEQDVEDYLTCPRCWTKDDHEVHYDPVEDSFMLECKKCFEAFIIDGDSLDIKEYNELYCMATTSANKNLPY
jgi:glutamine amidotransferase